MSSELYTLMPFRLSTPPESPREKISCSSSTPEKVVEPHVAVVHTTPPSPERRKPGPNCTPYTETPRVERVSHPGRSASLRGANAFRLGFDRNDALDNTSKSRPGSGGAKKIWSPPLNPFVVKRSCSEDVCPLSQPSRAARKTSKGNLGRLPLALLELLLQRWSAKSVLWVGSGGADGSVFCIPEPSWCRGAHACGFSGTWGRCRSARGSAGSWAS